MRRWSGMILVAVLALAAGGARAAGETNLPSLTAARAAVEDGLYDLARKQLEEALKTADQAAPAGTEAVVLLAWALWGQAQYEAVLRLLGEDPAKGRSPQGAGALAYWRAVARYELGQYDRALAELDAMAGRVAGDPYALRLARLQAWCRLRSGQAEQALASFAQFDRQYGTTPDGQANLLDWGQALLANGNVAEARRVLERLVAQPGTSSEVQEGKLWLAQAMVRDGKWEPAWNLLSLVAADASVRSDRRARAWLALSEVNAAQTNFEAAVASAAKGTELAPTQLLRQRGKALQGRWTLRQGKLDDGAALLREAIMAAPKDPVSGPLQLELAEAYLDRRQFEKAADEFQYYLETFTDVAGQVRALRGRGTALWEARRYAEAAAAFEKAAAQARDPGEREACLVKAADALFANAQYKLAGEAYERVLNEFPRTALTPQVIFQQGESLGRQGEWNRASDALRRLVRTYPDHPLAERGLMRIASLKEEQGPAFMREALAGYAEVMEVYPGGTLFPEALHRHGLAAYQLLQFDDALKDFTRVVNDYTNSPIAPQAFFMRGRSLYMMGREEEALTIGRTFVERYPDTIWTAGVAFWLGMYAFNHGSYAEAEERFLAVADKFPKDPSADLALLRAGWAALKQKEYLRAVTACTRMAETYPESPLMADARFLQGDALSELGEFSRAIVVFDDLIAKYPNNPLVSAAWGRRGDCQFTLGAGDAKRYDEAIVSYRTVMKSPGLTFDLELQAEFKIGRCLEKLDRKSDAFEQYYTRVMVRFLERSTTRPAETGAAAVWFTKAAFAAADILEADKNWRRAVRVLERVVEAAAPAARDARERIDRIRAEHWVW